MIALNRRGQDQRFETALFVNAEKLAMARGQMLAASQQSEGKGWRSAPFLWPLIEGN